MNLIINNPNSYYYSQTGGEVCINMPEEGPRAPYLVQDGLFIPEEVSGETIHRKVLMKDIVYLEAAGAYTYIHLLHTTKTVSVPMGTLLKNIEVLNESFLRISRKHAVNTRNIDEATRGTIIIGQKRLKIMRNYLPDIEAVFPFLRKA